MAESHYFIRTPEENIVIGELICVDGCIGLRIKKPNSMVFEFIPREKLIELLFTRVRL